MVKVVLDSWLREFGPRGEESVEANDLDGLFNALEARYPRLRFRLRDETGAVRKYVKIFIDGEAIDPSSRKETSITERSTVDILHSIAGG